MHSSAATQCDSLAVVLKHPSTDTTCEPIFQELKSWTTRSDAFCLSQAAFTLNVQADFYVANDVYSGSRTVELYIYKALHARRNCWRLVKLYKWIISDDRLTVTVNFLNEIQRMFTECIYIIGINKFRPADSPLSVFRLVFNPWTVNERRQLSAS